jgi:hypothetical protein
MSLSGNKKILKGYKGEKQQMKTILRFFRPKPVLTCVVVALLALSIFAVSAEAMFVPAASHQDATAAPTGSAVRTADLAKIQKALESKIIQQKLMDYGLSPEETMVRVNRLSDSQISLLASHADAIQAGGMRDSTIILILILVLLLILLI